MKNYKLRFWHPIIGMIIINIVYRICNNLIVFSKTWMLAMDLLGIATNICWILFVYIITRNIIQAIKKLTTRRSTKEAEELEHQREIERKEIDMVRKSNEILLHLIQDEHREKDR